METGFAIIIAALPGVFLGYVFANLERNIENLQNCIENLSVSIERLKNK